VLTGTLGTAVRYAFTDRHGGVSAPPFDSCNLGFATGDDREKVAANRASVATRLGLAPGRVLFVHQVHGAEVVEADRPWHHGPPRADGMATTSPDVALAVLAADCVPVLLADPDAGVVAAVHAGRAGLARGVVPAGVVRMCGLGARPERILAVTGPAVCGACYEVPADLQEAVAAAAPAAWSRARTGRSALDLAAGVAAQLRDLGVRAVSRIPICTMESPDHFSHRRDRATGRAAGYIWLQK
jgi:YfiH family protein